MTEFVTVIICIASLIPSVIRNGKDKEVKYFKRWIIYEENNCKTSIESTGGDSFIVIQCQDDGTYMLPGNQCSMSNVRK